MASSKTVQPLPPATPPGEPVSSAMIAEAAYYLAEKRGFAPGKELADWLQAEAQVEALARGEG